MISGALAAVAVVGVVVALVALRGGDASTDALEPAVSAPATDLDGQADTTEVPETTAVVAPTSSAEPIPVSTPAPGTTQPLPTTPPAAPVITTAPPPAPVPTARPVVTAAPADPCTRDVSYATEHLKRGDCGDPVFDLQLDLSCVGYALTVDGVFGVSTESAVREFQRSRGLTVDGQAGPGTRSALNAAC